MDSEKNKMLQGNLYDPLDKELTQARSNARKLLQKLNTSTDEDHELRIEVLLKLLGKTGVNNWIEPPFYCDYGSNIYLGDNVYFNFNCVILDPGEVHIGNNVLVGPNVQIYTATHPIVHLERKKGLELAKPVTIESDVWIGGAAIINPGVTIGSRSVIGSGSVVTKDIPEGVVAAGNPCRVIRTLE